MKKADKDGERLGYRPAVGIMLLNAQGEVFVARRLDMPTMPAWQMPQGGIDPGETPRQAALGPAPKMVCNALHRPGQRHKPRHPASGIRRLAMGSAISPAGTDSPVQASALHRHIG